MHALKNSLIYLYQENIGAKGISQKKIEGKLRKCPEIVRTNFFRFHHFVISCGDVSANAQFLGILYILKPFTVVHTLVDFHRLC